MQQKHWKFQVKDNLLKRGPKQTPSNKIAVAESQPVDLKNVASRNQTTCNKKER